MIDYDDAPAGLETDILLAKNVMKWTEWKDTNEKYVGEYPMFYLDYENIMIHYEEGKAVDLWESWSPTTSMHYVWQVVEKLIPTYKLFLFYLNHGLWEASFQLWERTEEGGIGSTGLGPTAPLTICRAALNATWRKYD